MMGMLDWFIKREKPTLSFDRLEIWCRDKEDNLNKAAEAELLTLLRKIDSRMVETRDSIKALEQAGLFNSKVTEREHQIMVGNRQTYIQKVGLFLDRIPSIKPGSIWEIDDFLSSFDREFETLAKSSARSYYLLSEFFSNEASDVAFGTKEIERAVSQIRLLRQKHSEDSEPFARMALLFDEFGKARQRLEELKAEEKQEDTEYQRLSGELKRLELEQKALMRSEQFHELETLRLELDEVTKKIKITEESIFQDFSILEKALKKYAKISTEEKFIEGYTSNLLASLRSDSELRIAGILERLKSELASGRLGIKERLQEKMLAKIDILTKDYLGETINGYNSQLERKTSLESSVASHPANQAYTSLDSRQQRLRHEHEAAAKKLEMIRGDIAKTDPGKLKLELKETAEQEFGLRIAD